MGGIPNLLFLFFFFVCTVTDFSAVAFPIGVKFCTAVQPHLGQVFSYFGSIAPGTAEFWASTGAIWRDMLLAEASLVFKLFQCFVSHVTTSKTEIKLFPPLKEF